MSGYPPSRSTGTSQWILDMKADIIELKKRLEDLEKYFSQSAKEQSGDPSGSITGENTNSQHVAKLADDANPGKPWSIGDFGEGGAYDEVVASGKVDSSTAMNITEATATVRQATISMRGYMLLLDQMGLNKEQKKMIKQLEESMMMILKLVNGIRLLGETLSIVEGGPLAPFMAILTGGQFAASMGYGMKFAGSGV